MSQKEIYPTEVFTIQRSLSVPARTQTKKRGLSDMERDAKIKEFERYISERDIITSEFEIKTATSEKSVHFSYFIGRLNPPHRGHISALVDLVLTAKRNRSKTLILFGSGPKQPNGERRTMDDPITFETKKAFVVSKLVDAGGREEVDFVIKEMTSPHANVTDYIGSALQEIKKNNGNISKIDIKHVAGGKDDDAKKLQSVLVYVADIARKEVPNAEVSAEVVVAAPPPSETVGEVATYMSATNVRKDAYRSQLPGRSDYDDWPEAYKTFYGPQFAREIFNQILYPLKKMSPSEQMEAINDYINPKPKLKNGTRKNKSPNDSKKSTRRRSRTSKSPNGSKTKKYQKSIQK